MNPKNQRTIEDHLRYLQANSRSLEGQQLYKQVIKRLAEDLGDKTFRQATTEDIERHLLNLKHLSSLTQKNHKAKIKAFYRWLNGGEYPKCVKWIKTGKFERSRPLEPCLTWPEVNSLVKHVLNYRDRAFIIVLYESGARITEVLNLLVKDVVFDEYGVVLSIKNEKINGVRQVRIIRAVPDLRAWLDNHPRRDMPNAHVFSLVKNEGVEAMSYENANRILKTAARKAGIKKRVHPHLFRHSRATELAERGLTQYDLENILGWRRGSAMSAVYVHGFDSNKKILAMEGCLPPEEAKTQDKKNQQCPWPDCKVENSLAAKYCYKCSKPLDASVVQMALEERERARKYLEGFDLLELKRRLELFELVARVKPELLERIKQEETKKKE